MEICLYQMNMGELNKTADQDCLVRAEVRMSNVNTVITAILMLFDFGSMLSSQLPKLSFFTVDLHEFYSIKEQTKNTFCMYRGMRSLYSVPAMRLFECA